MSSFRVAIITTLLVYISCAKRVSQQNVKTSAEENVQSTSSTDQLIFAHIIYRHGDRNIKHIYPNDPWKDESHWIGGFGQLTNEGKRQMYELGKYFRRRYGKLIGNTYSPKEVYVQSTDYDRTIMSAQVNLAGLYPTSDAEIWNENIRWHPIPVHTIPFKYDYALYGPDDCPKYWMDYEKYQRESPEVQRIYREYADDFAFWSEQCGSSITTTLDVAELYHTLYVEYLHKKSLAEWALKAIEPNGTMEYIACFHKKMGSATTQMARLQSGFLFKEILEHFAQKINSTLTPNRSLWLYSAHDITISYMLNSLGLFELHIPPFASSLHIELYKTDENDHYIQIFYRKSNEEELSPMNIPNCGTKCSLNRLYELYRDLIPGDHDVECSCSGANGISSFNRLVVVVILSSFAIFILLSKL